jgi:hypothetical protein
MRPIYDGAVLLAVWIGLAVAFVAVVWGAVRAITLGLRTWRSIRRFSRGLSDRLEVVAREAARAEEKAATASQSSVKLAAALERLQRSLAVLAILRAAAGEVSAETAVFRNLIPRK